MHLSVIVPAFNEEKNLNGNIEAWLKYLKSQLYSYELIIINDGSNDNTRNIAKKLSQTHKSIRLINLLKNRGKGNAVREGMLKARGSFRLFIDADNATSIQHLDAVWPILKKDYDIIIGSRNPKDAPGTKLIKPQSFWKIFLGKCGNLIFQLVNTKGIWDTQCGFKIFTAKSAEKIFLKTTINRWAFDVEVICLARLFKFKIGIIPVRWINSKYSRVGITGYFITLWEVGKIKINMLKGKYKT
ncbi:glycosyltransferase family 2 protein [bacterium]|nr:glycosyltransferase family 2 protein [bacterium]